MLVAKAPGQTWPAAFTPLHVWISRPATALGRGPVDVLGWVFDVAGFAVNAVLRIDLQRFPATIGVDQFVHPG